MLRVAAALMTVSLWAQGGSPAGGILQLLARDPNTRDAPASIERALRACAPGSAVALAAEIARRIARASAIARSEGDRAIAEGLLDRNEGLDEAEAYARRAMGSLREEDYLARERGLAIDEARERYRNFEAELWCTLGSILMRQSRDAETRQALQKSLAAARTAGAASAFATLAMKEGDLHTALDALGTAILTGKADRESIDTFRATYASAGPRFIDAEEWLDRRYRNEFRNPIQPPPFRGATAEPHRAVLLQLSTGVDCEACTPVDLAVAALLQRYSRQDLVVIAEQGSVTAPGVLIDGMPVECSAGTVSAAQRVFDALDIEVMKRVVAPARARIQLSAAWSGGALEVSAGVEGVTPASATLRLYLADTEVRYGGASGIRLHPMVTRAQAEFPIGTAAFTATHRFRPTNPRKAAVIAVVRDEASGRVLQSAYLPPVIAR